MDSRRIARRAVREYGAIQHPAELAAMLEQVHARVGPAIAIEIGCGDGGGLWALRRLPTVRRVIGVTLPGGAQSAYTLAEPHGAQLVVGDSRHPDTRAAVDELLAGDSAGFVFIDGGHELETVTADWQWSLGLVSRPAAIAFHDICPAPHDPRVQVNQLWEQLRDDWTTTELIAEPGVSQGTGIIWIG